MICTDSSIWLIVAPVLAVMLAFLGIGMHLCYKQGKAEGLLHSQICEQETAKISVKGGKTP